MAGAHLHMQEIIVRWKNNARRKKEPLFDILGFSFKKEKEEKNEKR